MRQEPIILEHGTVYDNQASLFGYGAWPSVAQREDGTLLVVFSGMRMQHVDPFGKVVMMESGDEGRTWSAPSVVVDTPLDDRDAGLLSLGKGVFLLTTFNNSRQTQMEYARRPGFDTPSMQKMIEAYVEQLSEEQEREYLGSLVFRSQDNARTFPTFVKLPISAPHGPVLCKNGAILYAGTNLFGEKTDAMPHETCVFSSRDGVDWRYLGGIPKGPEDTDLSFYEPHLAETPSGRLICHIRAEGNGIFTIYQSESEDGGKSWTTAHCLGVKGAPPHLLLHSSGVLISSYGRRVPPYGERVMLSFDEGNSWETELCLMDTGVDGDLGYPATTELSNGELFTVYYGKKKAGERCGIFYTRWRLPE